MITEDFVSFETAKLLKEKGFDELCAFQYYTYWEDGKLKNYLRPIRLDTMISNSQVTGRDNVTAPTLQMACKWLEKKHQLYCDIGFDDLGFNWVIIDLSADASKQPVYKSDSHGGYCDSTEPTEDAIKFCLKHLI